MCLCIYTEIEKFESYIKHKIHDFKGTLIIISKGHMKVYKNCIQRNQIYSTYNEVYFILIEFDLDVYLKKKKYDNTIIYI